MGDLGLLDVFLLAKTPEQVRDRLVAALLDETREIGPEERRDLAALLRGGHSGFRLELKRTTKNRPNTDLMRNLAIYQAINEARYRKRVGDQSGGPSEWREKAALSEGEWQEIVDRVIRQHNAACQPDDRWNPLNSQDAREKAFDRGYESEMTYRQICEAED